MRLLRKAYYLLMQKKRNRYLEGLKKRGLQLGRDVQIIDDFFFDPSHCFLISIGDNCVICPNVRLIVHDASTKGFLGYTKIGKIDIRENCFIGDSTIVLPGVTIGPNSIVGAGSVVSRDVPPRSVAVGNPAKVLFSLEDYLHRIKERSEHKRVFGEDYYIQFLDELKKKEILDSISSDIGFIV